MMIHLSSSPAMSRSINDLGGVVQQHRAESARYRSHDLISAIGVGVTNTKVWPNKSVNDEDVNNC